MYFLNLFRNRTYNKPTNFAMFMSQWVHQFYLWRIISYVKYGKIQEWFYK